MKACVSILVKHICWNQPAADLGWGSCLILHFTSLYFPCPQHTHSFRAAEIQAQCVQRRRPRFREAARPCAWRSPSLGTPQAHLPGGSPSGPQALPRELWIPGEGRASHLLQGGLPAVFCIWWLFLGPALLLTSDSIKQRLGSAALDRYEVSTWEQPGQARLPALRGPLPSHEIHQGVCAFQYPRVPAVQLAGAAGGHPPDRALPGGQHTHALDPVLHPTGGLHPHRGPGRAGAHGRRGELAAGARQ